MLYIALPSPAREPLHARRLRARPPSHSLCSANWTISGSLSSSRGSAKEDPRIRARRLSCRRDIRRVLTRSSRTRAVMRATESLGQHPRSGRIGRLLRLLRKPRAGGSPGEPHFRQHAYLSCGRRGPAPSVSRARTDPFGLNVARAMKIADRTRIVDGSKPSATLGRARPEIYTVFRIAQVVPSPATGGDAGAPGTAAISASPTARRSDGGQNTLSAFGRERDQVRMRR